MQYPFIGATAVGTKRQATEGQGETPEEAEERYLKYARDMLRAAWDILGERGIKSLGIDPSMRATELTEEEVTTLSDAVYQLTRKRYSQLAAEQFPAQQREWLRRYDVPESEWETWDRFPTQFEPFKGRFIGAYKHAPIAPQEEARKTAYKPRPGGHVTFTELGVTPETIAHEYAHAGYFEQMPESLRFAYPLAHTVAQIASPAYREAVGKYTGKTTPFTSLPKFQISEGHLPIEGYAKAYEELGKEPEKMPTYMEPFYGNLMYPVPEPLEKSGFGWGASWLAEKAKEKVKEKVGEIKGRLKSPVTLKPIEPREPYPVPRTRKVDYGLQRLEDERMKKKKKEYPFIYPGTEGLIKINI